MSSAEVDGVERWQSGPGLVRSLLARWYVVLAAGALGTGLTFVAESAQPSVYEASAELVVYEAPLGGVFSDVPRRVNADRLVRSTAERIEGQRVLDRVREQLSEQHLEGGVRDRITVVREEGVDVITVVARGRSGESAAALANTVLDSYLTVTMEEIVAEAKLRIGRLEDAIGRLERQIRQLQAQLDRSPGVAPRVRHDATVAELVDLTRRRERLAAIVAAPDAGADVLTRASVPREPVVPRPRRTAALGAVFAVALAGAYVYWRAGASPRAASPADVAGALEAPLLGAVPQSRVPRRDGLAAAMAAVAWEPYAVAATSLERVVELQGLRTLVCVSVRQSDNASLAVCKLAVAGARPGHRVVVIDADHRNRELSAAWGLEGAPGLTELAESRSFGDCGALVEASDGKKVRLVPPGLRAVDPSDFALSGDFVRALAAVREEADLVLLDVPPVFQDASAVAVAGVVDGVVAVVSRGALLDDLVALRERLELAGGQLIGFVFVSNRRISAEDDSIASRLRARAQPRRIEVGR